MATKTQTINAGPVGLKPKGAYNAATTYTLLDCVLYNHDSWVCKAMDAQGNPVDVTGQTPQDGSQYWQALTDGGRAAMAVGTQVRTDFDTWFGATANAGIRKTVSDWLSSVQDAWTVWFSDTLITGVRKIWDTWFGGVQGEWTTWFGADDTSGVQKQWKDTKTDAATATTRANTAAAICEDWNENPPYIGDGTTGDLNYWYLYDAKTEQYVKGPYAKGEDIDWSTISQEDYQRLVENVKEDLVFADADTCRSIVSELQ